MARQLSNAMITCFVATLSLLQSADKADADAAAMYAEAWAKVDAGDYDGAINLMKQIVEMGDARGYNGLGLIYRESYGDGTYRDTSASYDNFVNAAKLDYPSGHLNLAWNSALGIGTPVDSLSAEQSLKSAIALGFNQENYISQVERYIQDARRYEADMGSTAGLGNVDKFKDASSFVASGGALNTLPYHAIWGNCWVAYEELLPVSNIPIRITFDFNKANWKSAAYAIVDGNVQFTLSGDAGLQNVDLLGQTGQAIALSGIFLAAGDQSSFGINITVPKERFENAVVDLAALCPGVSSTY